jgi:Bacterial pre-peptidase C-terminal domain
MNRCCLIMVTVCAVMAAQLQAGGDKDKKPGKEVKFEGAVADTDPTVSIGGKDLHCKTHEVKLAGGKKYQMDLVKKDGNIDPFLIIQDKSGKILVWDDDGGGFPNARLSFNCPKSDAYKLFAAALTGEGGYTLTIKEVALSADEAKIHAVAAGGLKINGKLDRTVRSITYQVKMEADKTYVIDMISADQKALDPYLKLLDPEGNVLQEDDDGGEGLNSRITFRAAKAGVYRIVALPLVGAGDFTLEVNEKK